MHLRVPVRSLQSVLATARVRVTENENPQTAWEHWGFSLEDHLNDEEYIDLDKEYRCIDIPGIHIPHVGDIGDMTDTYFEELQRGAGIPNEDEVSEGAVQLNIPLVDTTDEGEKKQSAGSWMKHNI